jgi:hypothetical protein
MAINQPEFLQTLVYDARALRRVLETVANEGVADPGDLAVAAGSGLTLSVAAGEALIRGDDTTHTGYQGLYHVTVDSTYSGPTLAAADATNPRVDSVILRVWDATENTGQSLNSAVIASVQGTPAASPVAPALPATALLLANVTVPAGATSIVSSNISDQRRLVRPGRTYGINYGGTLPSSTSNSDALRTHIPDAGLMRKVRAVVGSGSCTIKLQKNGTDITGYTSLNVTTSSATIGAGSVVFAEDDILGVVVTATSSGVGLVVNAYIDH